MARSSEVIVIIPCYNEENTIPLVIHEIESLKEIRPRIVVVDDGSADGTAQIARELGVHVVQTGGHGLGYGRALFVGLAFAESVGASVAVSIDADGQFSPSEIPHVIRPIVEGKADLVIGSRFMRGSKATHLSMSRAQRLALRFLSFLAGRVSGIHLSDATSGLRAYSQRALKSVVDLSEKGRDVAAESIIEVPRQGLTVVEVPVATRPRLVSYNARVSVIDFLRAAIQRR